MMHESASRKGSETTVDGTVTTPRSSYTRGGRERLLTLVRPALKARLIERAIEADDSLSGYVARVLAEHEGMKP